MNEVHTRQEVQFQLLWYHQLRVDSSKTPVESANQALEGGRAHGQYIFDAE